MNDEKCTIYKSKCQKGIGSKGQKVKSTKKNDTILKSNNLIINKSTNQQITNIGEQKI